MSDVTAIEPPAPGYLALAAYSVVHYNYAWRTGLGGPGTLGKLVPLLAAGGPPLFLDDAMHAVARNALDGGLPGAPADWRCAGLIQHDGQLALVYVVRLRERAEELVSSGELLTERLGFDPLGQVLIANLAAL